MINVLRQIILDFCEIKQDTTILDGHKKQGWGYFFFSSCHRHVQPDSVKWLHNVESPPHLVFFWAGLLNVDKDYRSLVNTSMWAVFGHWVKGWVDFAENNFLDSAHFVCLVRVHSSEISQRLYLVTILLIIQAIMNLTDNSKVNISKILKIKCYN